MTFQRCLICFRLSPSCRSSARWWCWLCPATRAKKWLALLVSLVTFLVSLLLWVNWQNGQAGMQFVEDAALVPAAGHSLRHGRGRHQPLPGAADDVAHAHRHLLQQSLRPQPDRRLSGAHAGARDGDARRLSGAGPGALLRLLRGEPDPHVLPHRRVGRRRIGSMRPSSSSSTPSPARR